MENKLNQIQTKYVQMDPQKCTICWRCLALAACPNQVIGRGGFLYKHIVIKAADKCSGCKKCIKACKRKAFSEGKI